MAPLPVISNVKRITINFTTYGGVTPACVHHVRGDAADEAQLGEDLWDAFPEGLFGPMHAGFEPNSISILPLDGSSATYEAVRPGGVGTDLCLSNNNILPAVACVVSFATGTRGPQGRGRQYVGPITETSVTDGLMEPTVISALQTAWQTYATNLQAITAPLALQVASYTHEEARTVTSIVVKRPVATQRRRQRQLQ